MKTKYLGCWIIIITFAAVLIVIVAARAHDAHRPDLNTWFNQLQSGKGRCCSNNDGTALADVDWESKGGSYRVRVDGQWFDVPDDAVIAEPNLAGRTMVWPFYIDGRLQIRCFMAGSMG